MYHYQILHSRDPFINRNTVGLQQSGSDWVLSRNKKGRLETARATSETKINFYQCDGKRKVWRRREMAYEHFTSSIKHDIEYIIGWESMTATGTGSLVLIDNVTADRCSRKNCVQKCTFCSDSDKCYKTDRQSFTVQMVNDPKHTTHPKRA